MECILCRTPHDEASAAPWARAPDGREYFRCGSCLLVWLRPEQRPSAEAEKNRYLEHRNESKNPAYLKYLARLADLVCGLISPGARGIDYGCGPAEGMRAVLEPRGFRVSSYDPVFLPDLEALCRHYDFLLCNEAAEHFYAPAEDFARMDSIVVSGGILGFSSGLVRDREAFLNWRYRTDPTHVIFFSEGTVRWLAERFGWEILMLENPRFLFRKK